MLKPIYPLKANGQATRLAARSVVLLALCASATGCVSLANEEGRLPDAMRATINSLSANGYPDLTKIPEAPKDMPSATAWSSIQSGLIAQGGEVARRPGARAPTTEETNLNWAATERAKLEANPAAAALPAVVSGAPTDPDWAAAAKAKLEADLARLPPP